MRSTLTLLFVTAVLGASQACGNGGQGGGGGAGSSGTAGSSSGGGSGGSSGGNATACGATAGALQYHGCADHAGAFVDAALTRTAAAGVHRVSTFAGTITGNVYASPLYVKDGPGGKGAVFIATESDDVYALDETTGAVSWHVHVATAAGQTGAGCGNIGPIGITGTPAIDLGTRLIVFSAASADGGGSIATHTIHALSIDDGSEKWSLDVTTLKDPTGLTFNPQPQNQRSAVLVVNGTAYEIGRAH